jgi:hypothetical protein
MSETKVPAIPSSSSEKFSDAVKELIEVREGLRGDPLDQNVTLRQLQDAGIASVLVSGGSGGSGRPPVTISPFNEPGFMNVPPGLSDFSVAGGYTAMFISWTPLTYSNHSYVEIKRSITDNVAGAIVIGQSSGHVFTDACGSGKTFYYWGRPVSTSGVKGPYNAQRGTKGTTAQDVYYMLEVLNGRLTQSQLHSDLATRVDKIDIDSIVGSVGSRIAAASTTLSAGIAVVDGRITSTRNEVLDRLDSLIIANATGDAALVMTEQTARIFADAALSSRIDLVAAVSDGNTAAIIVESQARADAFNTASSQVTSVLSQFNTLSSAIQNTYSTIANTNAAIATATNSLTSRLNNAGGPSVSIESFALTQVGINGSLSGEYTLRIQTDGGGTRRISGFGLFATASTSNFEVMADSFVISAPSNTSPRAGVPFYHLTTPATIDGVTVPAGTWIHTAFIADATIRSAQIKELVADKITSGDITADRMKANVVDAANLSATYIRGDRIDTKSLNVVDSHGNLILSSSTKGTFSPHKRWDFIGSYDEWTWSGGVSVSPGTDALRLIYSGILSAQLTSPAIDTPGIQGALYPLVRMRIRAESIVVGSGGSWLGRLHFFANGAWRTFDLPTVASEDYSAQLGTLAAGDRTGPIGTEWVEVEWDLREVNEWINYTVSQIAFTLIDFSIPQRPTLNIDWIAIGGIKTGVMIDGVSVSTFIKAGTITNAYIGNVIQSTDYDGDSSFNPGGAVTARGGGNFPGTTGWVITKNNGLVGGVAVFPNAYVRGNIQANSISTDTLTAITATVKGTLTAADIEALNINVTTLNIAGDAVTVPRSVTLSSGITIPAYPNPATVGTITMDMGAYSSAIYMHAVLQVAQVSGLADNSIRLHLYESGNQMALFSQSFRAGFSGQVNAVATFLMPAGSGPKTYYAKVSIVVDSGSTVMQTQGGVLYVSGVKRTSIL